MTRNAITTIPFHGANIMVKPGETPETTLVAMKPVVEGMGLDWSYQRKKLNEHPVLSKGVAVIAIPSEGGLQDNVALPLNRLHFWLATIHPTRIEDIEVRERVILYQEQAADVLFEHFFGRALGHGDDRQDRQLGMSKMTIHKVTNLEKTVDALTYRINALIINTDARVAALEYVSVRELLEEGKAIQKGRGRLNRKIGYELRREALIAGPPNPCRQCPHSGVWLYQRDFAAKYMGNRGKHLISEHNAHQMGQGVINFGTRRTAQHVQGGA